MGLFGFFEDKPTPKSIEKQVSRLKEAYAHPEYRRAAMDKLISYGTIEALEGLLERFRVVVQSPHWDEEEKRFVIDELAKRGKLAKQALVNFFAKSNDVTHAIAALKRIGLEKAEVVDVLLTALKRRSPDDYRTSQSKMELIAALGELDGEGINEAIAPYIDDHNDDVRCMSIDVLTARKAPEAQRLVGLITEDLHSARVLRHAAAAVSKLNLEIDPEKSLAPSVAEDFLIEGNKLKSRRGSN